MFHDNDDGHSHLLNVSFFFEALKNLISTHNVANKVVNMEL
jgi:hypothetical protein